MLMQTIMYASCAYTSDFYVRSIFHAQLCMHVCKMENILCHVLLHIVSRFAVYVLDQV